MGGMVAQELALRHPDRIRTLVIGCSYAGGEGSALTPPENFQRLAEAWSSGDRERALRTGWEINVSPQFRRARGRVRALARDGPQPPRAAGDHPAPAAGGQRARHERAARADRRARRSSSTAPRTGCCPAANSQVIASRIPGARLEELDGVGHLFWWEQPERSAELVREHAQGGGDRPGDRPGRGVVGRRAPHRRPGRPSRLRAHRGPGGRPRPHLPPRLPDVVAGLGRDVRPAARRPAARRARLPRLRRLRQAAGSHRYSLLEQADAVEAVWRAARRSTRTALVCHDYGVSVGQELLARRDDRDLPVEVTAAAFLNGGMIPSPHRPLTIQKLLAHRVAGPVLTQLTTERTFVARPAPRHRPADGRRRAARALGRVRQPRRPRPRAPAARVHRRARPVRGPLGGRRSRAATSRCGSSGARSTRSAARTCSPSCACAAPTRTFAELAGVGHYPQLEEPGGGRPRAARPLVERGG